MPSSRLTEWARALRLDQTRAEEKLWTRLRNRQLGGWKWKRQAPRGSYIVDFYCAEAGLVVDLDGGVHRGSVAYDERRTRYLEGLGLRVVRFPNREVAENMDQVCEEIAAACGGERALTLPSPRERGEGF